MKIFKIILSIHYLFVMITNIKKKNKKYRKQLLHDA